MISTDAPTRSPAPLDADLVEAARADPGAFAAVYDRYADHLHDFCLAVLRDRDVAADAVRDALLSAARGLHQLHEPSRLRPWLYAIARNEVLRRGRGRARGVATEARSEIVDSDRGPGFEAERNELAALVWEVVGGLDARDRAIMDLSARHGLEGQELADALGVRLDHMHALLSSARRRVERSLEVLLVGRGGRHGCPEMNAMLADWGGRLEPRMRKRVARHIDECARCAEQRTRLVNPAALLAAVRLQPAPMLLRESFLSALTASIGGGGSPADAGPASPRPTPGASSVAVGSSAPSAAVVGASSEGRGRARRCVGRNGGHRGSRRPRSEGGPPRRSARRRRRRRPRPAALDLIPGPHPSFLRHFLATDARK